MNLLEFLEGAHAYWKYWLKKQKFHLTTQSGTTNTQMTTIEYYINISGCFTLVKLAKCIFGCSNSSYRNIAVISIHWKYVLWGFFLFAIMIPFSILTSNEGFNPVTLNSMKEVQAAILVLLDQKATSHFSYYRRETEGTRLT